MSVNFHPEMLRAIALELATTGTQTGAFNSFEFDSVDHSSTVYGNNGTTCNVTAIGSVEWKSYSTFLAFIYMIVAVILVVQTVRIPLMGHTTRSFQFSFFILCFAFVTVRGFYFLLIDILPQWLWNIFYWIPINIQFSTFSLLVLFLARIAHLKREDRKVGPRLVAAYVATNLFFLLTGAAFLVVEIVYDTLHPSEGHDHFSKQIMIGRSVFSSSVFVALGFFMAVYGYMVIILLRHRKIQVPIFVKSVSTLEIGCVIGYGLFAFFTRSLFDLLVAFNVEALAKLPVESGVCIVDLIVFILFIVWEILPTVLIILLFRRIPRRTGTDGESLLLNRRHHDVPINTTEEQRAHARQDEDIQRLNPRAVSGSYGHEGFLSGSLPGSQPDGSFVNIWENPQRYDSDDETLAKGRTPPALYGTPYSPYSTDSLLASTNKRSHG